MVRRRPAAVVTIVAVNEGDGHPERVGAARVEDLDLAARLVAGEQSALAEAYARHGGLVFGLARRVLHDAAMAEEVTQEVFIYLWEHPSRFDPARGTMRTWLGLLTHSRSVDRVRAEARRSQREARLKPIESMTSEQTEVDNELSRSWLASNVRQALDQLPPEQRDAVVLAVLRRPDAIARSPPSWPFRRAPPSRDCASRSLTSTISSGPT